jgi:RNA polymerase sigma-70 factor (ECF subfamily)
MPLDDNQQKAVEKLYMEMYYPLSAYAKSALRESTLAEEAVQDTYRIACSKVNDLLTSPNPKGWLLNTLKYVISNMIHNRARLNKMVISSIDLIENYPENNINPLDIDILYSDIANSEDYKLIKKIALDKYTMLEVAKEYGISIEASKKRVQRARKKLKDHFNKK